MSSGIRTRGRTAPLRILSLLLALCIVLTTVPTAGPVYAASNEETVFNYLVKTMGLNEAAACGVLSNIRSESGFRPNALGDNGTSYGICQWHNSRWTNLKNYCNKHGYDWKTLNGQLHFLEYELKNNYKSVYNTLKSVPNTAQGAYDAAYKWCYSYEVPANRAKVSVTRGNYAKNTYWPKYGPKNFYLDINGMLDGTGVNNIKGYGTCDVYINGSRVADDVSDYYTEWKTGTKYEIKDIRAANGHVYNGVYQGSLTGTIGSAKVSVWLSFSSVGVQKYVTCQRKVTLPARTVNLYLDPTDASRTYYLDNGATVTCPVYAQMSDGSVMYKVNVKYQGRDTQMWFKLTNDMIVSVQHTFGEERFEAAHPHAGYQVCACGQKKYTGNYDVRSDCVICSPGTVSADQNSVALDLKSKPSATVTLTAGGALPNSYYLQYGLESDDSCVTCEWGEWDGESAPLTITAKKNGSCTVAVYLYNETNGELIAQTQISVTVSRLRYTVTFDANGGKNPPQKQTVVIGGSVTIPAAKPTRGGCTFLGWAKRADASSAEYAPGDALRPDRSMTLYAVWKSGCPGGGDCPGKVFKDMPAKGNWAHDAVDWAVDNDITNGTDKTHFSPLAGCTRAHVVTFLWRFAGCPEPTSKKNPFKDVKKGTFYYEAVLWAVQTGVTKGTSATTFSPNATCTRGQIVTFLYRFKDSPKASAKNPFKDVSKSAFYYSAMLWAVENGITNGTSKTTFAPGATCTRAQVVTFLYRASQRDKSSAFDKKNYEIVISDASWDQALAAAKKKGGKLVCFESLEEYRFVLDLIQEEGKVDDVFYSLGGRRDAKGKDYFWADENNKLYGKKLNGSGAWCAGCWESGEPNLEWNGRQEDAVMMYYSTAEARWAWYDGSGAYRNSKRTYGYIIEYGG